MWLAYLCSSTYKPFRLLTVLNLRHAWACGSCQEGTGQEMVNKNFASVQREASLCFLSACGTCSPITGTIQECEHNQGGGRGGRSVRRWGMGEGDEFFSLPHPFHLKEREQRGRAAPSFQIHLQPLLRLGKGRRIHGNSVWGLRVRGRPPASGFLQTTSVPREESLDREGSHGHLTLTFGGTYERRQWGQALI